MSDEMTSAAGLQGAAARQGRRLSLFDRCLFVPLGFLWLVVLAVIAVPVILWMSLLYYAVAGWRTLVRRLGLRRNDRQAPEDRIN